MLVETDNVDPAADRVLVQAGAVVVQEGQDMWPLGTGKTLVSIDGFDLNDSGSYSMSVGLDGSVSNGLYSALASHPFNPFELQAQVLFPQVTGPHYLAAPQLNNADQVLLSSLSGSPGQSSLVLVDSGVTTTIAQEGLPAPGTPGETLIAVGFNPALGDNGSVLFSAIVSGPADQNEVVVLDGTVIAREGSPAPVPGANWSSLSGVEVHDLNAQGDALFTGDIGSSTSVLLARNGEKFICTGETVPGMSSSILYFSDHDFTWNMPAFIADRAAPDADPDVFWFGATFTGVESLFVDEKPLLRIDQTTVAGSVIQFPSAWWSASSDGRYVIAQVFAENVETVAVLLDRGPWVSTGKGTAGTAEPKLHGFGQLEPGAATTIEVRRTAPGSAGALVIGLTAVNKSILGGTLVPKATLILPFQTDQDGIFTTTFAWPAGFPPGSNIFMQAWLDDPGGPSGFSSTNGIHGTTQ